MSKRLRDDLKTAPATGIATAIITARVAALAMTVTPAAALAMAATLVAALAMSTAARVTSGTMRAAVPATSATDPVMKLAALVTSTTAAHVSTTVIRASAKASIGATKQAETTLLTTADGKMSRPRRTVARDGCSLRVGRANRSHH